MREERLPGGFKLRGAPGVFPLGQDSVLLAAFARPAPRGRALDLGCGGGALSLLLLGRYPALSVTALDFDPAACALARENLAQPGAAGRAAVLEGDLRRIRELLPHGCMDFVVCNPPYFTPGAGARHRTLPAARAQEGCSLGEIASASAFVLKGGGKLALVYRPEGLSPLLAALCGAGLEPKRLRFVHQRPDKAPSAVLLEAKKGARPGLTVLPPLLVEGSDGGYSAEYRAIYHNEL